MNLIYIIRQKLDTFTPNLQDLHIFCRTHWFESEIRDRRNPSTSNLKLGGSKTTQPTSPKNLQKTLFVVGAVLAGHHHQQSPTI